MKEKILKIVSVGLVSTLLLMLIFSANLTPVLALNSNVSVQNNTVHSATEWSQVQSLIDNASENDIIDITKLCFTTAEVTLSISKNITIKCESTGKPFAEVAITNLFFEVSNNATLTLENLAIKNIKLNKSVISGTGNAVISKSILEPDTSNGTPTVYNAPATIDLLGNVSVKTDSGLFSCSVAGATIIQRNSSQTGKAGTAIKAVNVTINGGHVVGGASFESNCDSGDGIVASGNVTINGVRQNGTSNVQVQSGSIGTTTVNTTVGLAIRFTEDSEKQRVLSVHGGDVLGTDRSTNGNAIAYTVKMSANDIAIIDNSKIGWYTDVPVFSDGFFYITNPVNTWGTLDDATEVYPLTSVKSTLSGTKMVTYENTVSHYAPKDALITITANAPDNGKQFKEWMTVPSGVTFENSKNATTTFAMPANTVEVTATYEDIPHTHTPSTTWFKDAANHWHECTANDGEKLDVAAHTPGEPATINHSQLCTVCGYEIAPKLPSKDIIVDNVTGTKIEYEDGSVFDTNISLVVTPKSTEEMKKHQNNVNKVKEGLSIAGLYDIKLLKDGVEIQPNGMVKITLMLTDEMKTMSDLQVVYIDDAGKVIIVPSQLIDGKLVFVTDHFSYYGVIGKEKPIDLIQPETPNIPDSGDTSNQTSPQTVDTSNTMLYIALIALFGGAIISIKRRKYLDK